MSMRDDDNTQEQPANAGCGAAPCSSPDDDPRWSHSEDDCHYYDENDDCHFCGGDGWVDGDELGDPGWYLPGELYKCTCCGGSGKGADCTFW